jgi:formylglycine-generating enzyme required for sulfatase activity
MKKLALLLLFITLCGSAAFAQKVKIKNVAVVETELDEQSGAAKEITKPEVRQITTMLRREAVNRLPRSKYNVMTAETVQAMGDAVLAECADENCIITLGSKIGADYIVRGIISKFRTRITLEVELYETDYGNLVASAAAVRSANLEELLEKGTMACADMYKNFAEASATAATASTSVPGSTETAAPASMAKSDFYDYKVGIDMVFVKGGTFTLGKNKAPIRDFYIGKYEVTQKQWVEVMDNNPSYFKGKGNLPVENVKWSDVQEFIKRLNTMTGRKYRLPTEAEWECAARGGSISEGFKYAGSDNIDDVAWYNKNSGKKTHIVGGKSPNELGIHDMSGNVWELVSDLSGYFRVARGGGWSNRANRCRVSNRNTISPDYRYYYVGFRLVLSSP